MRLDKLLGNMGFGTRKELKEFLREGLVTVDGKPATRPELSVDPERQLILFQGTRVVYKPFVYLMMNKPQGVLSATEDRRGQRTAVDLVGREYKAYDLSPAGRLDIDTEGFLLLTNDGDFLHRVITPKNHIWKEYFATVEGIACQEDQTAFAEGILLADGTVCMEAELDILEADRESACSAVQVRICEGKFHQVKRMLLSRGLRVTYLKRTAIGGVRLDETLSPGEYRELTMQEKEIMIK